MERKIGETFEFEGGKFEVKAASCGCDGCFFDTKCLSKNIELTGECEGIDRDDGEDVIFVEVQEQPQEQAEQPQKEQPKLNLCEILKDCPQGETFWSPMLDGVKFSDIDDERQMIIVETVEGHFTWEINHDGTISIDEVTSPEVMLYPSKDQRDWSKFTAPWLKKERFDPKTLKPFDRVLGRNHSCHKWTCDLFSDIIDSNECMYHCINSYYRYCIPYNDETKHLVGTEDEAPEYYRYWED